MAAIPNPWIGIPAGLAAGFIASGVVGKIQDWLRQRYGPSTGPLSQEYEAAAAAQQPLAYQAGRVAPIAAGMTTGAGVSAGVRAVSGALLGGADVAQQAITKGPGNIDWREAGIQAGAGALLPQARPWAGGARTSAQQGETPVGKPAAPDQLAEQQAQGQQTEASGVTSSAKGSAEQKPPPANSRLAQVDQNTVLPGETISVVQSNRQGFKEGVNPAREQGIQGAPSTVIDSAAIPADVQAAVSPMPQSAVEPPNTPPASVLPVSSMPNAPISSVQPSAAPIPTPAETGLEGARVPSQPEAATPQSPTPTGLEGQVPNAQQLVENAFNAAVNRPIVRQPMPSIANSSKDINGPVVVDPRIPDEYVQPLAVHETVEQTLMAHGMPYDQAHQIATAAERTVAEQTLGLDWDKYSSDIAKLAPAIEAQKVMPDTWANLNLHENPYAAIGHHTDKDILGDLRQDEATPELGQPAGPEQFSTIKPEEPPTGGKEPDLNEIPDFLRRPAATAYEAQEEGTPHSLGAAAADMEKENGQAPPPPGAEKAINAGNPGKVPFRARRAAETWLNNTWFGKILSPTTMDETGEAAKTDIRGARGAIKRTQDAFDAALGKPMENLIGALSPEHQREIQIAMQEVNPMERLKSFPELEPAIKAMRMTAKKDETFIRAHGDLDEDQFQQWYFPQLWKDQKQAGEFFDSWMARQGASGGLKTKKFPDIPTGLANGLELKYDNPIAAFRERRNGLYQYLMMNNILKAGIDRQMVVREPGSDVVPLSGRGLNGQKLYAPEGYATVFNNAYSPGWRSTPAGKQFMDLAQPTTNWGTGVLLGMSAFHPFTMLNEGFVNEVGLAMQQGPRDPVEALKSLAWSPAGALRLYRKGLDVAKEWTNRESMGDGLTKIVDNLERANGRAIGHSDPTYKFIPDSWKSFSDELKTTKDDMQAAFANANTVQEKAIAAAQAPLIAGKATLRTVGAVIGAAAKPLFGHIIPMMKNGAFRQNMGEWLVQNPTAPLEEQTAAAMKIWDDIENRFGLMTHDNIFWDNKLKEGLQLGLTSYSWQMGAGRNLGGGAAQWALHPTRFSMKSPNYDPRLGSTLALAITVATMSAAYQYLKTGQPPQDVNDLLAGRTGGKTSSGQPERAILPGFQKDVYGWLHDPLAEAQNKLGVVPRTALEMVTNKGWVQTKKGPRYGMISNPAEPITSQIQERATHAAKNFIPIVGQQIMGTNTNPASNITVGERAASIRPAPKYINPGGNIAEKKYIQREWSTTHPR